MDFTDKPWNPDSKVIDDITQKLGPETASIQVGNRVYAPRDILKEVRAGTEFGRQFYQMHSQLMDTLKQVQLYFI
ncbi:MAG TPA: hypothetical protein VJJ52_07600 [Candidatus Nanoarchaeia archaeon]|nr:hypothetical protein [Candidatus Nanoarchaeia archaeon]